MAEKKLEPFTAKVLFLLSEAAENDAWKKILSRYMEAIADRCDRAGRCVIGHIKGLTLGPDKSYLQVSVISPSHSAEVKGELAKGISELVLTLNVLVYGLSRDSLECIVRKVSTDSAQGLVTNITVEPIQEKSEHINSTFNKTVLPVFPK